MFYHTKTYSSFLKVVREKKAERKAGKEAVSVEETAQVESYLSNDETVSFGKNALIKDDLDEDLGEYENYHPMFK